MTARCARTTLTLGDGSARPDKPALPPGGGPVVGRLTEMQRDAYDGIFRVTFGLIRVIFGLFPPRRARPTVSALTQNGDAKDAATPMDPVMIPRSAVSWTTQGPSR